MKFAGFIKTSTVDYPKKIVSVVFTAGCNFYCEYCHNPDLIKINKDILNIDENEIFEHLEKRKGVIDGICITGGEPSLYGDELINFAKKIKEKLGNDFLIKVDTNGSNPEFLSKTINIFDFIAMDFKGINYSLFSKINEKLYKKSLEIIKNAKDYEIRITMYPEYIKEEDFDKIVELLQKHKKIIIQQFKDKKVYKDKNIKAYSEEILENFKNKFLNSKVEVEIRK